MPDSGVHQRFGLGSASIILPVRWRDLTPPRDVVGRAAPHESPSPPSGHLVRSKSTTTGAAATEFLKHRNLVLLALVR